MPRGIPKSKEDKTAVGRSPHAREIKDRFESGWSASSVLAYLHWRFPNEKHPGLSSLASWRKHRMPTTVVVPHALLAAKLRGIDYTVDLIGHLSRLVYLLEQRVFGALSVEESLMQGVPIQATDRAVETYLEALRDWRSCAEDLGLVPRRDKSPINVIGQQNNLNVLDPGLAKELLDYVREFREIEERRALGPGAGVGGDEEEP